MRLTVLPDHHARVAVRTRRELIAAGGLPQSNDKGQHENQHENQQQHHHQHRKKEGEQEDS